MPPLLFDLVFRPSSRAILQLSTPEERRRQSGAVLIWLAVTVALRVNKALNQKPDSDASLQEEAPKKAPECKVKSPTQVKTLLWWSKKPKWKLLPPPANMPEGTSESQ